MRLRKLAKRVARRLLAGAGSDRLAGHDAGVLFDAEDVQHVCDTYVRHGGAPGTPWDALRDAHMRLPAWFTPGLDAFGPAYAMQQHRLWQLVSGLDRPYVPQVDEKEHDWGDIDPVRSPGFYVRRDARAIASASDHILATGMLLKHCGLQAGDWALEYGAGFGQTALALARLGVRVDTVDISATFCRFVGQQADFFQVPLQPFLGEFGNNPRPGQRYQLIWFYESFHHCVDFQQVVLRLREHLAEGGRVILGGEPIVEREYAAVPYPWGVRLHSEVVAVVRQQHWFELGFSEDFLNELFTRAGFIAERVDCEPSLFGRLYIFRRRPPEIHVGTLWLPTLVAQQWHAPQRDGRPTRGHATLPLDASGGIQAIEVDLANLHAGSVELSIECGSLSQRFELASGQQVTARFDVNGPSAGGNGLVFRCRAGSGRLFSVALGRAAFDQGVFVRRVRYVPLTAG